MKSKISENIKVIKNYSLFVSQLFFKDIGIKKNYIAHLYTTH